MNRQQLIKIAKSNIDEKRFSAEERCDKQLYDLRQNSEFRTCEKNLRLAQVMGDGEVIAQRKAEMETLLAKINVDKNTLYPQYDCKRCNDTGYINGKMCSCLKIELNKLLTAQSNVINQNFTFDKSGETNKHNLSIYNKAREITEGGEMNLLLTGPTGTGKTYLMTACVNLATSLNKSALFYTAYNLNAMFLNAHLSDYQTRMSILDALTDADILLIDDLGTEIVYKNVTAEYLFSILNERLAQRKQTFISTNLSLNDLRDRYDERIFSRLVDQRCVVVAQLNGADKRLTKK